MHAPLIPITFSFLLGIIIGKYLQIPNLLLLWILSAGFILLLLGILKKKRNFSFIILFLSFSILGIQAINPYVFFMPSPNHISNLNYSGIIGLEGIVCENPVRSTEKTDLIVDAVRVVQNGCEISVNGRVLLSLNGTNNVPQYRDLIRAKVKLKKPHNFNNPGQFDYERFLRFKGILIRGYIDDPSKIIVLRNDDGHGMIKFIEAFRDKLRSFIKSNARSEQAAILIAMVLGEQTEVPKDTLNKFNRTGTTHILAISGFNVGIVFLIFIFVIKNLLKTPVYLILRFDIGKIAAFLTAVPVILYAVIAGMGGSVIRATLMFIVLILALLSDRERDLPNTLALTALLILASYPPALFDVSCQLSFAAVASILFIVPRFADALESHDRLDKLYKAGRIRWALNAFYLFLLVTVAATLGTIPLIMYYFNTLSLIVVVGNVFLIPIMGYAVTGLSIAILLTVPLSETVATFLVKLADYLIRISLVIIDKLAALPWASVYVATPSPIEIAAYVFLVIGVVMFLDRLIHRRKDESVLISYLLGSVICFMVFFFIIDGLNIHYRNRQADRLSVTFIDVGQGNASLVRLPGGEKILIDGGGFYNDHFDIGRNVVAPFLWHEKITEIDTVILTHPHPDHLNGLPFILQNFSVKEVWSNGIEIADENYINFRKLIADLGIRHCFMNRGSEVVMDKVSFRFLNPKGVSANKTISDQSLNDGSLVTKLIFNKISFLFPGDISAEVERELLRFKNTLRSDIILATHHGSRFSNSLPFLKKVHPRIVIFSCGKDNAFHLPSSEIVERYKQIDSEIRRTDQDGAVTIETDGDEIRVQGFEGSMAKD